MTLVAPSAIQGPQSSRSDRPCPIREERARWMAQAARDGHSLDEIAAALGVSKTRVCTTLTGMGIRRRRPNHEALRLERLGAGRWGGKSGAAATCGRLDEDGGSAGENRGCA